MLLKLVCLFAFIWFEKASGNCTGQNNASCGIDVNATFTDDRVLIQVRFQTAVKPESPYSGCGTIFANATLDKLGSASICAFVADAVLNVYPDRTATITTGDSIDFEPDSVLFENGTSAGIGSVSIESGPNSAFVPTPVITEEGYASTCVRDKYYVSADFSENSGYTFFSRFDWMLDNLAGNESGMESNATTYLEGKPGNESEILLTSSVFNSNQSMLVNITNAFGESIRKEIGVATLSNPVARISGRKYIDLPENAEHHFEANLVLSRCGMSLKNITYSWNIQAADDSQSLESKDFMFSDKLLVVKPFSLLAGRRYNITVSMDYYLSDGIATGLVDDVVYVTVRDAKLAAAIEGGDREIALSQTLVLRGREKSTANSSLYSVQWSCRDLAARTPCKNNDGVSLEFGNAKDLVLPMSQGNFVVGRRYEFKLTVIRNTATAYASIRVTIISAAAPLLSVLPLCHRCGHAEDIFFRGVLLSDSSINYSWQVAEKIGNAAVLSSSSGSLSTDHENISIPYNVIFKIPKNTLQAGYAYEVKLTAISRASASAVLQLGVPPRHGQLRVEPQSGIAFDTMFRLRSFAWIDQKAHKPLHYRFGYTKGIVRRYLTVWRSSNVVSRTLLPPGNSADGNRLTLFVQVRNVLGLIAENQFVVTVASQQAANDSALHQSFIRQVAENELESMPLALEGLFKSGLSNETKQTLFASYLNALKNVQFIPSYTDIFLGNIVDLLNIVNKRDSIFTLSVKESIAALLKKETENKGANSLRLNGAQVKLILDTFLGVLPNPGLTAASDKTVIQSFLDTTESLTTAICRSALKDPSLTNLENSLIKIASRISDFANDVFMSDVFAVNRKFRRRAVNNLCSGESYVDCIGTCSSVRTFKDAKYFNINESELVTNIYHGQLIDMRSGRSLAVPAESGDFNFTLPISGSYNRSTQHLKCVTQEPGSLVWSDRFCNATVKSNSGGIESLVCTCAKLYPLAGVKKDSPIPSPSPSPSPSPTTEQRTTATATSPPPTPPPADIITLVLKANCTKHLDNGKAQKKFSDSLEQSLEAQLRISRSRIKVWSLACGSIIANVTISDPDPSQSSEPTKSVAMGSLAALLSTGLMQVTLSDGTQLGAAAPGVSLRTLPPPTTVVTTRHPVPELTTNWMPMMASFALILALVIGIASFIAWLHGRYYKKKKFTEINCDKKKKKPEKEEESFDNMSQKQKAKKFDTIMDESLENAEVPDIIVAAPVSLKRTRGKSRITPIHGSFPSSVASSRSNFATAREVPRLALDDSSSGSEAETSFTERPKSTASAKSRTKSATSVKSRQRSAMSRNRSAVSRNYLHPDSRLGDRPQSGRSVVSTTGSTQNLVV